MDSAEHGQMRDLEDRGLMTEAGRQAFEKAFEYEIIPPDSEINQRIKEEAKLRRPEIRERYNKIRDLNTACCQS